MSTKSNDFLLFLIKKLEKLKKSQEKYDSVHNSYSFNDISDL